MASWNTTTKHEPNSINNGNKYEKKDRLSLENVNAITENSFYAVRKAEDALEKAESAFKGNGTIVTLNGESVASIDVDTTPQESGTNRLITSAGVANALKNFKPSGGNEYDDTELRGLINNKANLDASNLNSTNVTSWKSKLGVKDNTEQVETIYDMHDSSKDWGYSGGLQGGISFYNKADFSKFKGIYVYSFSSNQLMKTYLDFNALNDGVLYNGCNTGLSNDTTDLQCIKIRMGDAKDYIAFDFGYFGTSGTVLRNQDSYYFVYKIEGVY